jgi:hypothetical protein
MWIFRLNLFKNPISFKEGAEAEEAVSKPAGV